MFLGMLLVPVLIRGHVRRLRGRDLGKIHVVAQVRGRRTSHIAESVATTRAGASSTLFRVRNAMTAKSTVSGHSPKRA